MLRIERDAEARRHPVSYTQDGFFALGGFPTSGIFRLTGPLDVAALERAVVEIARRHEVLRSSFHAAAGRVEAQVWDEPPAATRLVDLTDVPDDRRTAEAMAQIAEERHAPFDYSRPPLFRLTVRRLGPELHLVLIVIDHIVFDGWSFGVFVREIVALYNAFSQGSPSPLPTLPVQYWDFARWQRRRLSGGHLDALWSYWERRLADNVPGVCVPADAPRSDPQGFELGSHPFEVPGDLTQALRAYSRGAGLSLFMTLMTGFQAFLRRLSGLSDVSVLVPTANRMPAETEVLIGPLINLMIIRVDLEGDPTFADLGRRVRSACLSAYGHQEMPFEVILGRLGQDGSYTTMLTLENYPVPPLRLRKLVVEELDVNAGAGPYDLSFLFFDSQPALRAQLAYNSRLFSAGTAARYAAGLLACLRAGIAAPGTRVSSLPIQG
jgi:condensation domain-containing protein